MISGATSRSNPWALGVKSSSGGAITFVTVVDQTQSQRTQLTTDSVPTHSGTSPKYRFSHSTRFVASARL
jgi:hypothetical protein